MELTELRKLQLLEVNLLQKFQQICKENNIKYFFVGGGLIGVLRHGGFIPWDDDMDVVMPRDDYDRFLEICRKGLDDGYGIESDWHYLLTRFVDCESIVERPSEFETLKENVWIDLFPIDGIPNRKFHRWLHIRLVLALRFLLILTDSEHLAGKKKRPFYETCILKLFKALPLFKSLNPEKLSHVMEKQMRKYRFKDCKFCCNYMGRYRTKEIHPKEQWGIPTIKQFEGIDVYIPEQYHEMQTSIYGDYMQLPPENERVAHEAKLLKHRDVDFELLEARSKRSRFV